MANTIGKTTECSGPSGKTTECSGPSGKSEYIALVHSLQIGRSNWFKIIEHVVNTNNTIVLAYIIFNENFIGPMNYLISDSSYYPLLGTIMENNKERFIYEFNDAYVYNMLHLSNIPKDNNIQLLNIIITHLPIDNIIIPLICSSFDTNNLPILDIFHEASFNIELAFDKYLSEFNDFVNFKHTTCVAIQEYGIDLYPRLDLLSKIFCETNNISGVEFCVNMGCNPTTIMKNRKYPPPLKMTKCLIDCGVDLTQLDLKYIKHFIEFSSDDVASLAYLIDIGLDISTYVKELMVLVINKDYVETFTYLIKLGYDIHYDNEYLLFYSAHNGHIECLKILLENGADIHAGTKSILSYKSMPGKWINQYVIDKILIKHGAITHDYHPILCRYIKSLRNKALDKEYFIHLLELGIDLNLKFNDEFYIFEAVILSGSPELIKICVEYGADPCVNNCRALMLAIRSSNIKSVKILLELGLSLPILNLKGRRIVPEIIQLLDQYNVPYKKID